MAILKAKEISKMNEKEIKSKIDELKIERIKAGINNQKAGKSNMKEIRRTIARLLTFKKVKMNQEKKLVDDTKNKKNSKENKSEVKK